MLNKRSELLAAIEILKPDIIAVTEVKPKNGRFKLEESELSMDDYDIFHDLQEEGRGVILYTHSKLKASLCTKITSDFSEHVIVECKLKGSESLLVCVIYRRQDLPRENAEHLNTLMEAISQHKSTHKIVLGDFNYPEIDWISETSSTGKNHIASKFLKASKDALLIQHQKTPTRFREGQKSNTLDLVFTDSENLIKDLRVEAPLGKSDHYSLSITLSVISEKVEQKPKRNYRKMDPSILKEELSKVNWNDELKDKDTEETWTYIKEKTINAINKSTPMTKPSGRKGKPWMNHETIEIVRNKHRLFREWHRKGNKENEKKSYNRANNRARKACRKANREYERKVAEQSKSNPKLFFHYANSKMKAKSGIADLNKQDGTKTKTDSEKAELLNDFFQSVFTVEDDGPLPEFEGYDFETELNDFEISTENVKKLLSTLNRNKASGPDEIPPGVLAEAANELSEPIAILFRRSLESGSIPKDWKQANVTPIFKKGSKASVNNYRPVSPL